MAWIGALGARGHGCTQIVGGTGDVVLDKILLFGVAPVAGVLTALLICWLCGRQR